MQLWIEAKRAERRKENLNNPHYIESERRFQELKEKMREGYRPIKTSEIENLFLNGLK